MKIIKKLIPLGLMAMPFAAGAVNVTSFDSLVTLVNGILDSLVPLIIGVAVVILLIAIVNYIRAGEEEEKRDKAKSLMIYGIVGLFVMVSLWGLVAILSGTFNLNNTPPQDIDQLLPPTI